LTVAANQVVLDRELTRPAFLHEAGTSLTSIQNSLQAAAGPDRIGRRFRNIFTQMSYKLSQPNKRVF